MKSLDNLSIIRQANLPFGVLLNEGEWNNLKEPNISSSLFSESFGALADWIPVSALRELFLGFD